MKILLQYFEEGGWETISFTLFLFLRAFHLYCQVQGKKARSKSHCSKSNLFIIDNILPKLQIMLVCLNSNSREPRGNPKHALPLWFSISSVSLAVLSYTLFPFQTRIILAFMDSTNKSEMS